MKAPGIPLSSVPGVTAFAVAVAALCACGGGGGGASAVPHVSSGTTTPAGSSGNATLSFTIPGGNTGTSKTRASQSVPSSINGVLVYAYAGTTVPSTPALVGDLSLTPSGGNKSLCVAASGGRQCSLTFSAPVGTDTIAIQLYDSEPVGGAIPSTANLVASGSTQIAIGANGTSSGSITLNSISQSFGASGGSLPPLTPTATASISSGSVNLSLPSGLISGNEQVSVSEVLSLLLPLATQRHPQYVAGSGNTEIYAFGLTFAPPVTLTGSMSLSGTTFTIAGSLATKLAAAPAGTFYVALQTSTTYVDVGTVTYSYNTSTSVLTITSGVTPVSGQNGISGAGIYVLYLPPAGSTSTLSRIAITYSPANVTIGVGSTVTATVSAFDANNNPIAVPVALTNSDASGAFTLSATTVNAPGSVTITYSGNTALSTSTTLATSTSGVSGAASLYATSSGLNVYALTGVNGLYTPIAYQTSPPTTHDPAAFNSGSDIFNSQVPPITLLQSSTNTAGRWFAGDASVISSGYNFGASGNAFPGMKDVTCTNSGIFSSTETTCAVAAGSSFNGDGGTVQEFVAVQSWPFYVGSGASSNLSTGSYCGTVGSDDGTYLVLAPSPFTYAQPGNFAQATGLTSRTAFVNNGAAQAYRENAFSAATVNIGAASSGAAAPDANLYWITMEYVELLGGPASLSYTWGPCTSSSLQSGGMSQGVVYGQVRHNGAADPSVQVNVSGTILTTDSNGFYGYNYTPTNTLVTWSSQSVTVAAGGSSRTVVIMPGQAVRQDFDI